MAMLNIWVNSFIELHRYIITVFVVLHQIFAHKTSMSNTNLKRSKIKEANFPTSIQLYI